MGPAFSNLAGSLKRLSFVEASMIGDHLSHLTALAQLEELSLKDAQIEDAQVRSISDGDEGSLT